MKESDSSMSVTHGESSSGEVDGQTTHRNGHKSTLKSSNQYLTPKMALFGYALRISSNISVPSLFEKLATGSNSDLEANLSELGNRKIQMKTGCYPNFTIHSTLMNQQKWTLEYTKRMKES